MLTGELISLAVAVSWTATALFAEVASKRIGSLPLNVIRMTLSLAMLMLLLLLTMGSPFPLFADGQSWLWLGASGFVGYVFGDFCLFRSYELVGSRFGQLFMTLASPAAALMGFVLLGETMGPLSVIGMAVTLTGIGMSVMSRGGGRSLSLKLPVDGVLYGIGAGVGQGVGLVLSKVGMQHYYASMAECGIADVSDYVVPDAVLQVPVAFIVPFASTMIRAIVGLVGFSVAMFFVARNGRRRFARALADGKAMRCAAWAALFGPFVGVGLSLMATMYTNAGIAQTIMALTPVLVLAPARLLFHQPVTRYEVLGACISVGGVVLFFV